MARSTLTDGRMWVRVASVWAILCGGMVTQGFAQFGGWCGWGECGGANSDRWGGLPWRLVDKPSSRFLQPVSPAIEPPPPIDPARPTPYEAVQAALRQRIEIDLQAMPLSDFAKWLENKLKVQVALDTLALEGAGVSTQTPLTCTFAKAPAKELLRLVLAEASLTWKIDGEMVLFTTAETGCSLVTLFYDVVDLAAVIEPKTNTRRTECQSLIDIIIAMCGVPKPGWVDHGGAGTAKEALAGIVAISQTPEVHEQIAELLATLRRIQAQHRSSPSNTMFPSQSAEGEEEERELRKKLAAIVTLEFKDTPLDEIVRTIAKQHAINLRLDFRALEAAGVDKDVQLTFPRTEAPLGDSLKNILGSAALKMYFHGGTLLFSTEAECEKTNRIRLYPVRDLLSHLPEGQSREEAIDELCELLKSMTGNPRPGWVDDGGVGELFWFPRADVLVISQVGFAHEEVEASLADLRRTIRPAGRTLLGRIPNRDHVLTLVIDRDHEGKLLAQPEAVARIVAKLLPNVDWQADGAMLEPIGDRVLVRNSESVLQRVQDIVENELRGLFAKPKAKTTPLPGGFF